MLCKSFESLILTVDVVALINKVVFVAVVPADADVVDV